MALEDLKPQLPRFTGSNPNLWISQSELFFQFYSIYGDERFSYVIEVFEDEPFYWFNSWFRSDDLTWSDFITAMLHRFCSSSLIPKVDTAVNLSPPFSALQVFDEMPDRVKHRIFIVDHETMNDEVLKVHTDSMDDVHESFEETDTQPDLLDSNFVLQNVKSSPHCPISSSDSPQPTHTPINTSTWHCLEIQPMRSGQISSTLLVVHNFEWKPGWYCAGIEYETTRIHDVVVDGPLGSPQTDSQDDANESFEVKDAQMDILDDVVFANDSTTKDMVDTNDCDAVASFVINHHKVRWLRIDSMVIQPISTQMVVTASLAIHSFA